MSPSIFDHYDTERMITRIKNLTPESKAKWGKMSVDQMLAHLNIAYEITYDTNRDKPGMIKRLLLKLFVKKIVVGHKPYKKNNPTAPEFVINGSRDFDKEKARLIGYIQKVQTDGENEFRDREYANFGKLSLDQWNNLFYKHFNHHLNQFGV